MNLPALGCLFGDTRPPLIECVEYFLDGLAAVSIEPSEGSFDDPSPWEELKTGRVGGAFDNLDGPLAEFGESVTQIGAVIDTVGEEMAQPGKQIMDRRNDKPGTIAILDI